MAPIDITQESEIPPLAEMLYSMYNDDGLFFMVDALREVIEFLPQLYPSSSKEEREKQIQILNLELIVKFCQYSENLAALALTFKSTFGDGTEEKLGLFKKISSYGISEIVDFYTHIEKRNTAYVSKFVGYPPLELQEQKSAEIIQRSCDNIKSEMTTIGTLYQEYRALYDAYKHGYRLFFGRDDNTHDDAYAYIDSEGKQKAVTVNKERLNQIFSSIKQCRNIIRMILQSHNERVKNEENGEKMGIVNISRLKKPNDPQITGDLRLTYPTRGDKLLREVKEGEETYNMFKESLEMNHNGKIVAIDMDEKNIVAIDYDIKNVMATIKEKGCSGRLRIRRIGKNDSTGIGLY